MQSSSRFFFFQAEDGIRDLIVTGVQTCALPIFTRTWGSSATARLEVPLEPQVLVMLDQLQAVPVDDGLGQPGRARGEQDVDGMIDRELIELERRSLRRQLLPAERPGHLRLAVRNRHDVLDARDLRPD